MIFLDNKDKLSEELLTFQEKIGVEMDDRNNLHLLDFQHPRELEIFQSQVSRLHMQDRLYRKIIEDEVNLILINAMEFHQLEVEATTQALPPKRCYVSGIDLANIISGNRIYCMS